MYSLHLKYLSTMADMALSCSQAYTTAMSAHLEMAAKTMASAADATKPADPKAGPFTIPEFPQPGQSWYRAPQENPFLAFWDDMLKPWRTYATNGWPGIATYAPPHAHEGMQAAFAFAQWLQQWGDMVSHAANAMSQVNHMPGEVSSGAAVQRPEHTAMPVAEAKIRFPDNTEVTITIPYLPVIFAGTAFLNKPRT